jgi:hypothetical protein
MSFHVSDRRIVFEIFFKDVNMCHGKVGMTFNDPGKKPVRPTMCHFFYMDPKDPTKVIRWIGAVGPTGF